MAKSDDTTSDLAGLGMTPEAEAALEKARNKRSEDSIVASPAVATSAPASAVAPAGSVESINGLTVRTF